MTREAAIEALEHVGLKPAHIADMLRQSCQRPISKWLVVLSPIDGIVPHKRGQKQGGYEFRICQEGEGAPYYLVKIFCQHFKPSPR